MNRTAVIYIRIGSNQEPDSGRDNEYNVTSKSSFTVSNAMRKFITVEIGRCYVHTNFARSGTYVCTICICPSKSL